MQLNASLLHEIRMVLQHASKLLQRSGVGAGRKGGSSLLCATCLRNHKYNTSGTIRVAVTVIHGNALCMEHIS